jgi:GntR family transcriptional regulator
MGPKMSIKNALPVYVQISEMLIRDVNAGHYLDGARLPPERQMAKELGVSVTTLRKALNDMTHKGMLEKRQGSGNYIKTNKNLASVYSFFRVELIAGGGLPTAELLALDRTVKPTHFPAFGKGN